MIKVAATDMSVKLNVGIKELGRIATPGEEFEVSNTRYPVLTGRNQYKAVFVKRVKEKSDSAKINTPLPSTAGEKPKKKRRNG